MTKGVPVPTDARFLYILRDGDVFKVGASRDPEGRCRQLSYSQRRPGLRLVHKVPTLDWRTAERAVHATLAPYRLHADRLREWFRLNAAGLRLALREMEAAAVAADLARAAIDSGLRPPKRPVSDRVTSYRMVHEDTPDTHVVVAGQTIRGASPRLVFRAFEAVTGMLPGEAKSAGFTAVPHRTVESASQPTGGAAR